MKAKVNNKLAQYERERDALQENNARTVLEECRLQTVNEVIKVLNELRR